MYGLLSSAIRVTYFLLLYRRDHLELKSNVAILFTLTGGQEIWLARLTIFQPRSQGGEVMSWS